MLQTEHGNDVLEFSVLRQRSPDFLGELGVADRWRDIAIGAWSTGWNFGPEYEPLFYESYGVAPDPDRIAFYRLLWACSS